MPRMNLKPRLALRFSIMEALEIMRSLPSHFVPFNQRRAALQEVLRNADNEFPASNPREDRRARRAIQSLGGADNVLDRAGRLPLELVDRIRHFLNATDTPTEEDEEEVHPPAVIPHQQHSRPRRDSGAGGV